MVNCSCGSEYLEIHGCPNKNCAYHGNSLPIGRADSYSHLANLVISRMSLDAMQHELVEILYTRYREDEDLFVQDWNHQVVGI